MLYGTTQRNLPSRFLVEIPDALTERVGRRMSSQMNFGELARGDYERQGEDRSFSGNGYLARARQQAKPAVPKAPKVSYSAGDTVVSKVFGQGVILSAKPMGNDTMLEIAFEKAGTKKLMANYAKLDKK